MVRTKPTILLTEAFPDAFDGKGIFSEMENMPWSETQTVDPSYLDLDYFGNHSGDKKCSPLVYKLMSDDHTISDENRSKLAALVVARFLPNWQALWNTYHLTYNPIADYTVSEIGTNSEENAGSNISTRTGSNTGTDNTSHVYGKRIEKSDEVTGESHNFKFGFNSNEHVPTDDTVVHTIDENEEVHSGTDSDNRTLNLASGETETGSNTGTKSGEYTKERTGLTGAHTVQELIQRERDLWIVDYFERVFRDVDSVLASMIYVRENHRHGFIRFPFGYRNY